MAIDQTGIMALPEADQAAAPTLSLEDSYDAVKSALQEARPDAASDMDAAMQEMTAEIKDLSDEELDAMIDIVQQMHNNPEQYQQLRAQLIADDQAEEDDFPADYDPEYLAMVMAVLMEAKRSRTSPVSQTPEGFAKGGIASAAESLARKGRYGDTMLAHINPREARLLKQHGGSGRINPATGLREYGWLKKFFKKIGNAVKKFLGSKIGKVIGTVALAAFLGPGAFGISGLGLSTAVAMPLASAGTTLMAGGDIKDALKSAAFSYIAGPGNPVSDYVSGALGSTGLTGTALQAATSGVIGTGVGLLSGQKLSDAVKSGFTSAALTAAQGKFLGGKGFEQDGSKVPVENRGTMANYSTVSQPSLAAPGDGMDYASGYVPPGSLPEPSGNLSEPSAPTAAVKPISGVSGATAPQGPAATAGAPTTTAGGPAAAGAPTTTAGPGTLRAVPSAMDAASDVVGNLGKGEFGEAFKSAKDLFAPSAPSNAEIMNSTEFNRFWSDANSKAITAGASPMSAETALKLFKDANPQYNPGILRTYGPAVVGGLGLMGAMGGFEQKPLELTEEQKNISNALTGGPGSARDLLKKYPNRFYVQGLPEVPYFGGSVLPPVGAADGGEIRGYNTGGTVNWGNGITIDRNLFPSGWAWETYLRLNPDLATSGIDTEEEARRHYSAFGYTEGRRYTDPISTAPAGTSAARIKSKYSTAGVEVPGVGMRDPGGEMARLHEDTNRWWQQSTPGQVTNMGGGVTMTREGLDTAVLRNPNTGEVTAFRPTTNYDAVMRSSPSLAAGWAATYGARPTENPYIAGLPKLDFQGFAPPPPPVNTPVQKAAGGIASISHFADGGAATGQSDADRQWGELVQSYMRANPDSGFAMANLPSILMAQTGKAPATLPSVYKEITPELYGQIGQTAQLGRSPMGIQSGTDRSNREAMLDVSPAAYEFVYGTNPTIPDPFAGAAAARSAGYKWADDPSYRAYYSQYGLGPEKLAKYQQYLGSRPAGWVKNTPYFENEALSSTPARQAAGGIAGLDAGGYPRRTGQISGPGTEKSDSIPAMLSDGEFVMTAKAVRGAGNGSRREGAKKMYKLMHQLERNASRG